MSEFKPYQRRQIAELRPYVQGEYLGARVSISVADREAGSPKPGDMIARNPKRHDDQWLVSAAYFEDNFELATLEARREVSTMNDPEYFCPQCGPMRLDGDAAAIDEDGCCVQCGGSACAWDDMIEMLRERGFELVREATAEDIRRYGD